LRWPPLALAAFGDAAPAAEPLHGLACACRVRILGHRSLGRCSLLARLNAHGACVCAHLFCRVTYRPLPEPVEIIVGQPALRERGEFAALPPEFACRARGRHWYGRTGWKHSRLLERRVTPGARWRSAVEIGAGQGSGLCVGPLRLSVPQIDVLRRRAPGPDCAGPNRPDNHGCTNEHPVDRCEPRGIAHGEDLDFSPRLVARGFAAQDRGLSQSPIATRPGLSYYRPVRTAVELQPTGLLSGPNRLLRHSWYKANLPVPTCLGIAFCRDQAS